ncbi:MAG: FAD-dependent oxidoreductase [Clostridia bacterium]|nr:FAD-dependent oxidoreductase [Clostridia bacterium]
MKLEQIIQEKGRFDVIVVGGGIAGVAAAVAASRGGAKTLLLEKGINLGGLATGGLISWYEPLCDGEGKQMIFGLSEEMIRLATRCGFNNLPKKWGGKEKCAPRNERYSSYFSPTVYSLLLDRFALENGVTLRFETLVTRPVMKDGLCRGIITESAGGSEYFEADVFIDASGDAVLMHRAGVPTVVGKNYMSYIAHGYLTEDAAALAENHNTCAFRKWINSGSNMNGVGQPEKMARVTGVTAEEITDYLIIGKSRMLDRISEWEENSFDLMMLPTMPQFRTIRRICGNRDFCGIDGETFEDSIGDCGDFRKKNVGKHYQIPFGCLWNRDFPNLIACGRIVSAPEGDGWEVTRVIPVCALTGEAAGKAAALCVKENKTLREIDSEDLKKIRIEKEKE